MRLKDHLNKLEYFSIIVESGSLLKASEHAFISQPQLSKILKQLEETLEQKLLVRSASGITPTPAGVKLYKLSKSLIKSTNEVELLIKSVGENIKGVVRIGTYDSISRYFFPDFLKFLKASMPDLDVVLAAGRSVDMLTKLEAGDLDIMVTAGNQSTSKKIVSTAIYSDAFGLYKSPKITQSFEKHLIFFQGSINDKSFMAQKIGFPYALTCGNLETVKSLAEQGLGVGLLPHRVAREGVMANRLVAKKNSKLKKDFSAHQVFLSYPKTFLDDPKKIIINELERFLEIWSSN